MKRILGYVLYEGPSVLDGQPIVAIATMATANVKTGPMVQTWILRQDVSPLEAVKTGVDESVCGHCPQRHFNGGACYVVPYQAPGAVWRSYKAGKYRRDWDSGTTFRNLVVRLGAYGDPAAVPSVVWADVTRNAAGWTGYTHQARHPNFDSDILSFVMRSVDTVAQFEQAHAKGHRTFRIKAPDQPLLPGEILCPATGDGTATCATCGACSGARRLGPSVAIDVHGSWANRFTPQRIAVKEVA